VLKLNRSVGRKNRGTPHFWSVSYWF